MAGEMDRLRDVLARVLPAGPTSASARRILGAARVDGASLDLMAVENRDALLVVSLREIEVGTRIAPILMPLFEPKPPLSCKAVATRLEVSRGTIYRWLFKVFGVGYSEVARAFVLEHVIDLLAQGKKLDGIATHLGFSGRSAVCRSFQGRFGVSPCAYRPAPDRISLDVWREDLQAP